jgi:hypothetical protein
VVSLPTESRQSGRVEKALLLVQDQERQTIGTTFGNMEYVWFRQFVEGSTSRLAHKQV